MKRLLLAALLLAGQASAQTFTGQILQTPPGLTANRIFYLPDANGTFALIGTPQSWSGLQSFASASIGSLTITGSCSGCGTGTVTSVALTVPSIFGVSGSPVTTSGTLGVTLNSQAANLFLAGPASGAAATPTFRGIAYQDLGLTSVGDLPFVNATPALARLGIGSNHQFLAAATGVPAWAQPAFTDISGTVAAGQLPNPSSSSLGGVQSIAAVAHNFLTSISTSGVPAQAQPDFSDLTGTAGVVQKTASNAFTTGTNSFQDQTRFQVCNQADGTKCLEANTSGNGTGIVSTIATTDSAANTHTLPNATGTLIQTGIANPALAFGTVTHTFNGTGAGFQWGTTGGYFANDASASFSMAASGTANALHGTTFTVVAKTSNYSVLYTDNRQIFTNTAAAGAVIFTLPTPVVGYDYTFVITTAQTLEVLAAGSAKIQMVGTLSGTNGNTQAATVGNTVRLVAVSSSLWLAIAVNGTWTTT
ncbi:MAG TPA: hypothetical protein VKW04_24945 [Planctomycetota bacterium]|nr:hypothetical protein [Planctomycetota bacterium]